VTEKKKLVIFLEHTIHSLGHNVDISGNILHSGWLTDQNNGTSIVVGRFCCALDGGLGPDFGRPRPIDDLRGSHYARLFGRRLLHCCTYVYWRNRRANNPWKAVMLFPIDLQRWYSIHLHNRLLFAVVLGDSSVWCRPDFACHRFVLHAGESDLFGECVTVCSDLRILGYVTFSSRSAAGETTRPNRRSSGCEATTPKPMRNWLTSKTNTTNYVPLQQPLGKR
jgi:hypothetical protein